MAKFCNTATEIETKKVDETELARPSEDPTTTLLQGEEIQLFRPEVTDTPTIRKENKENKEIEAIEKVETQNQPEEENEEKALTAETITLKGNITPEQIPAPHQIEAPELIGQIEEKPAATVKSEIISETVVGVDLAPASEIVLPKETEVGKFVSTLEVVAAAEEVDDSEKVASELSEMVLDSSSVPIQVAESVLQSEPKESVSEEQSPVSEEVVSSVVPPVLESVTAVSETVAEPKGKEETNGDASGVEDVKSEFDAATQAQSLVPKKVEQEPEAQKSAPLSEEKPDVVVKEEEEPSSAVSESSKSASLTPPDSPSTQGPVRPARTKDPKVPTTPIVTEATPPNSPPIGAGHSLEDEPKVVKKVVRKVVKKVPADGSEGPEEAEEGVPEKKVVKKVIKKVVKKPKEAVDDGNEASGATAVGGEKPKRVVKIVKKIVKPSDSLAVDTSVPETPPVGVPIPPKRKTKTTTTKVTTTTTTTTKSVPADNDKPSQSEP